MKKIHAISYIFVVSLFLITSTRLFAGNEHDKIISVPENFGSIKDTFDSNTPSATIIYIQDSHISVAAQKNVANIIRFLRTNHNIDSIYIEGASGIIDTSELSIFPDASVKQPVSDYYLKKGYIDGSEYLSIIEGSGDNNPFITIHGVEDKKLYLQNVQAFLRTQNNKHVINSFTTIMQKHIEQLKPHIYSDDLYSFDKFIQPFHNNEQDFAAFCAMLTSFADSAMVLFDDLEQLASFIELNKKEKNIDFNRVNLERQLAVHKLSNMVTLDEANDLLRQELLFKTNKISIAQYVTYFSSLCEDYQFDVSSFSEFKKFIDYMAIYTSIDLEKVLNEANHLETRIFQTLLSTSDEKNLYNISECIRLITQFEALQISKENLNRYNQCMRSLSLESMELFISDKCAQFNKSYESSFDLQHVEHVLMNYEEFYRVALRREHAMVSNLLKQINGSNKNTVIFIAGGFHKDGISDLLRKQNISYTVITPSATGATGSIPYMSLLNNTRTPLDHLIGVNTSTLKIASWLAAEPLMEQSKRPILMTKIKMLLSTTKLYNLYVQHLEKYPLVQKDNTMRQDIETKLKNSINHIIKQANYDSLLTISNVEITGDGLIATLRLTESGKTDQEFITVRYNDEAIVSEEFDGIQEHVLEYVNLSTGLTEEFVDFHLYQIFRTERFNKTAAILSELQKSSHDFISLMEALTNSYPELKIMPVPQQLLISKLLDSKIVEQNEDEYSLTSDESTRFAVEILTGALTQQKNAALTTGVVVVDVKDLPETVTKNYPKLAELVSSLMIDTGIPIPLLVKTLQTIYEQLINENTQLQTLSDKTIEYSAHIDIIPDLFKSNKVSIYLSSISSDYQINHLDYTTKMIPPDYDDKEVLIDEYTPQELTETEKSLFYLAQLGDQEAEEKLVRQYNRLIYFVANKRYHKYSSYSYQTNGLDISDFVSYSSLGLLNSIRNFDPEYGVKFMTYAIKVMNFAISRYMQEGSHIKTYTSKKINLVWKAVGDYKEEYGARPSIEQLSKFIKKRDGVVLSPAKIQEILAISKTKHQASFNTSPNPDDDSNGLAPENTVADESDYSNPFAMVEENSQKRFINYVISFLNPIDQDIIRCYDLDESVTYDDLAKKYNLSRQRIEQRRKSSLKQMKVLMDLINAVGRDGMDEFQQYVLEHINNLPHKQQVFMRLTCAHELTVEQSAERLNINKAAMNRIKNGFYQKLKDQLLDHIVNNDIYELLSNDDTWWKVFFRAYLENHDKKVPGILVSLLQDRPGVNIPVTDMYKILSDFDDISELEKEILVQKYVNKYHTQSIADFLNISEDTIDKVIATVLDKTAAYISNAYPAYLRKQNYFQSAVAELIDTSTDTELWSKTKAFFDYFNIGSFNKLLLPEKGELVRTANSFLSPVEQQIVTVVFMSKQHLLIDIGKKIGLPERDLTQQIARTVKKLRMIIEYMDAVGVENMNTMRDYISNTYKTTSYSEQVLLRFVDVEQLPFSEVRKRLNIESEQEAKYMYERAKSFFLRRLRSKISNNKQLLNILNSRVVSFPMLLQSSINGKDEVPEILMNIVTDEQKQGMSEAELKKICRDYKSYLKNDEIEILRLRYKQNLKIDDIGPIMNVHPKSITHRLRDARKKFWSTVTLRQHTNSAAREMLQDIIVEELNALKLQKRMIFVDMYLHRLNLIDTGERHNITRSLVGRIRGEVLSILEKRMKNIDEVELLMSDYNMKFEEIIIGLFHNIPEERLSPKENTPKNTFEIIMHYYTNQLNSNLSNKQLRQIAADTVLFLNDEYQDYLKMRYIDKMTNQQIADLQGKSKYTINHVFTDNINAIMKTALNLYTTIGNDRLLEIRQALAYSIMDLAPQDKNAMVLYAYDNLSEVEAEAMVNMRLTPETSRTKYLNRLRAVHSNFMERIKDEPEQIKEMFSSNLPAMEYMLKGLKHQIKRDYFEVFEVPKNNKKPEIITDKYDEQFLRNIFSRLNTKTEPTQFDLQEVAAILDSFNDIKFDVLELSLGQNLNRDQAAKKLGIPPETLRSRLRFSLEVLRRTYKYYNTFTPKQRKYVRAKIAETIQQFNYQKRSVLMYRYYDDLSMIETNELLGISDEKFDLISYALKSLAKELKKNLDDPEIREIFESKKHNKKNILLGYFLYSLRAEYPRSYFGIPEIKKDWVTEPIESTKDLHKYTESGQVLGLYLKLSESFNSLDEYEKNILYLYYFHDFSIEQLQTFLDDNLTAEIIELSLLKLRNLFVPKLQSLKMRELFENNRDEFETFFKQLDKNVPFNLHQVTIQPDDQKQALEKDHAEPMQESKKVYTKKDINKIFYNFSGDDNADMKKFLNDYLAHESPLPDPLVVKKSGMFEELRSQDANADTLMRFASLRGFSLKEANILQTILVKSKFITSLPAKKDVIVLDIDSIGFHETLPSHNSATRKQIIATIQKLQAEYDAKYRDVTIVFFSQKYDMNQIETFFGPYIYHALKNDKHKFFSTEILPKFGVDGTDESYIKFLLLLRDKYNVSNVNMKVFSHDSLLVDSALAVGAITADRGDNVYNAINVFAALHPLNSLRLMVSKTDLTVEDLIKRDNNYNALAGCEFALKRTKKTQRNLNLNSFIEQSL